MFRLAAPPCRCSIAFAAALAAVHGICQTAPPAAPPSTPELRVFDPSLIDKTVDPCENFYRFSCNGWFKRNPLPPDQASYGRFTELAELNRLRLKLILEVLQARRGNPRKASMSRKSAMSTRAA